MNVWKGFQIRFFCVVVVLVCCGYGFGAEGSGAGGEGLIISSIEISGNALVGREEMLSKVQSRVGREFSHASAAQESAAIGKLDGIKYSEYEVEVVDGKVHLTFKVQEQISIRSIVFLGNNKLKDKSLKKATGFKEGDFLDESLALLSIGDVEKRYRKKGYSDVKVGLRKPDLREGRLVYEVDEGGRRRIKKVTFSGNEAITSKSLSRAVKTRKRKYFVLPAYYSSDVVAEDIVKLKDVYKAKGYLDVEVSEETKTSADGRFAYPEFTIAEGALYTIGKIEIEGNVVFGNEVLFEDMRLKPGSVFSDEVAQFDADKIGARYRGQGFVDAHAGYLRSGRMLVGDKGTVNVKFNVEEGGCFRIGLISIKGNNDVHDNVVRRILDEEGFVPGALYNADIARGDGQGELEKTIQRLVMTESTEILPTIKSAGEAGETVEISDSQDGSVKLSGHRDAEVTVSESQTGSVMLGAGVASDSGLMGQLVFDQRNFNIFDTPGSFGEFITGKAFKGAGQHFRASVSPGTEQSSYSVSFTEPYLYGKPVSLDTVLSGFERFQEANDERRAKFYVGVEKRYKNGWRRGTSFRFENVDITDIDLDAPQEIKDDKGDNLLLGARLFINKRTTDSRFTPSKGYNFDASYEQVSGDHNFGVAGATQRWYKTLYEDLVGRKTILETKIRGATIIGNAPTFEKFYAGGTGSIRGFDYRGVSTRGLPTNSTSTTKRDPIGSDWIVTANAEVAVPLTSEALSWLFFVDTGVIDTGGPRASIGTGIQILIPQWFGPVPMRFEIAAPIAKDEADETRVFSFSVGALF